MLLDLQAVFIITICFKCHKLIFLTATVHNRQGISVKLDGKLNEATLNLTLPIVGVIEITLG